MNLLIVTLIYNRGNKNEPAIINQKQTLKYKIYKKLLFGIMENVPIKVKFSIGTPLKHCPSTSNGTIYPIIIKLTVYIEWPGMIWINTVHTISAKSIIVQGLAIGSYENKKFITSLRIFWPQYCHNMLKILLNIL